VLVKRIPYAAEQGIKSLEQGAYSGQGGRHQGFAPRREAFATCLAGRLRLLLSAQRVVGPLRAQRGGTGG
jgi:hypothetical protein